MVMDALQFDPRKKTLTLVTIDLPAIVEKNEVLVEVVYAGVCGTDLHILEGSFPVKDRLLIPGHEFCGVVTSVGPEVRNVTVGDHVVVDPNRGCGTCNYCSNGQYHLCPAGGHHTAIGVSVDGGFARFCKAPDTQVYPIPQSINFQQAALCEPLSCISHGWDRLAPLPIGTSILIIGAGIVGNLWTALLHHAGHRKVIVSEPNAARRVLNQQLKTGFQCLSPDQLKALKTADPDWGVDLCIDCSGNGHAIHDGLSLLLPGGKLCIFGAAAPSTIVGISPYEIFKKELTIVGVLINQFSFPKALNLIEAMGSRYLDYNALGIKVFSLEQHQEAIQALKQGIISKAVFKLSSNYK